MAPFFGQGAVLTCNSLDGASYSQRFTLALKNRANRIKMVRRYNLPSSAEGRIFSFVVGVSSSSD